LKDFSILDVSLFRYASNLGILHPLKPLRILTPFYFGVRVKPKFPSIALPNAQTFEWLNNAGRATHRGTPGTSSPAVRQFTKSAVKIPGCLYNSTSPSYEFPGVGKTFHVHRKGTRAL